MGIQSASFSKGLVLAVNKEHIHKKYELKVI